MGAFFYPTKEIFKMKRTLMLMLFPIALCSQAYAGQVGGGGGTGLQGGTLGGTGTVEDENSVESAGFRGGIIGGGGSRLEGSTIEELCSDGGALGGGSGITLLMGWITGETEHGSSTDCH
jgi:hypothetical protein